MAASAQDAAGIVDITSAVNVREDAAVALLHLSRSGSTSGEVSVLVQTASGTATAGSDFLAYSQRVTFAGGEIDKAVPISVVADGLTEGDEDFTVSITDPSAGAQLGATTTSTVHIIDGDDLGSADVTFTANLLPLFVKAVLPLPDGKALVGGQTDDLYSARPLTRLLPDGSVDPAFNPGLASTDIVYALLRQPDGKILVGGTFSQILGATSPSLARLNLDGSLDLSFHCPITAGAVEDLAMQSDGSIIVVGEFATTSSSSHYAAARFLPDGTLDPSLALSRSQYGTFHRVVVAPDGRIVVVGSTIRRLNADGTFDSAFVSPYISIYGPLSALTMDAQGRILIAGNFQGVYVGQSETKCPGVARLLSDGSLDSTFFSHFTSNEFRDVDHILCLPGNRLLIAGYFSAYGGQPRSGLACLSEDGTLLPDYALYPYPWPTGNLSSDGTEAIFSGIDAAAFDNDGRLLVGGAFLKLDGLPLQRVARLRGETDAGVFRMRDSAIAVPEGAQPTVEITVERIGGLDGPASIHYATADGTAKAGLNYTDTSGTLYFADGQHTASFAVDMLVSSHADGGKTFAVKLDSPSGDLLPASLIKASAATTVTILDPTAPLHGALLFENTTLNVTESAPTAKLTVRRIGGIDGDVTVHFQSFNGTGMANFQYAPLDGILTLADGQDSATIEVTIPYSTQLNWGPDTNFTVRLDSPSGGVDLPPETSVATVTVIDDLPVRSGVFGFDVYGTTIREGAPAVSLTVFRRYGSTGEVTVPFHTIALSAVPGRHYTSTAASVTFADGVTSATIAIPLLNDDVHEPDRTFRVVLDPPGGLAYLDYGNITVDVTITDDDPIRNGTVQFSAPSISVSESAWATVYVTRTGGSDGAVSVPYHTVDGSARAGQDYTATSGQLYFPSGNNAPQAIAIPISNDALHEPDKSFQIALGSPTGGASLGPIATCSVTIDDDDPARPGTVQFSISSISVNQSAGFVQVSVKRTDGSDGEVSVPYSTVDGSARAGRDFVDVAGQLRFPDHGGDTQTIAVSFVMGDFSGPRTFQMVLGSTSGGAALGASTCTVTITDDYLSLPATFRGNYVGLIGGATPVDEPAFVKIALTATGKFTGTLDFAGARSLFKDTFDSNGTAELHLSRFGQGDFDLTFHLDHLTGQRMFGSLDRGGRSSDFTLQRLPPIHPGQPAAVEKGTYTVILEPLSPPLSGITPVGSGFGALSVSHTGAAHYAGRLADGTPLMVGGQVAQGHWLVYARPYAARGLLAGSVAITPRANLGDEDCAGDVYWKKPAVRAGRYRTGFIQSLRLSGSCWNVVRGIYAFYFGDGMAEANPAELSSAQRPIEALPGNRIHVTQPAPDHLTLVVAPRTGLFTGSFLDHAGKRREVKGAVLRYQNCAAGYYTGVSEYGGFSFAAVP